MKKRSRRTRSSVAIRTISETSAGAIAFYIENKAIRILALVQNNPTGEEWFDMPKGKVKKGETLLRTAQREVREEIGLSLHLDTNFREEDTYVFTEKDPKSGKKVRVSKRIIFFLAPMNQKDKRQIAISSEHRRYYFIPIDEAIEKTKFENQKELLKKAESYITKRYILHEVN